MSATINPWVIVGGAAAIYFLTRPSTPSASTVPSTGVTSLLPPGITNLLPGGGTQQTASTAYGINSGQLGARGNFYTVANYQVLLAAHPNLGNPNYQMTAAETAQYLANYADLNAPDALPSWVGKKQPDGTTPQNIQQAAQAHWKFFGCAEQRIFLPLQPPSNAAYHPPPVNTQAANSGSGSSWVGSAISTVGSIALALLGNQTEQVPVLNNQEVDILVTGAAIAKKILPFYLQVAPDLVHSIENNIDAALSQYQD